MSSFLAYNKDMGGSKMVNTLVIYEGKYGTTRQVAHNVAAIIGNCKVKPIDEAPQQLNAFQNVVLVFCFRGYDTLSHTRPYLKERQQQLKDKKLAVIGIGLTMADLAAYVKLVNDIIPVKKAMTYFVQGQLRIKELTAEDCKVLEAFTKKVKIPFQDMGRLNLKKVGEVGTQLRGQLHVDNNPMQVEDLKREIDGFINKHNMLALATGSGNEVRCSPVEYIYEDECFFIITEGGLKFRGLTQNNKVSFSIYDAYEGMDKLGGLQVTAKAQIVPMFSVEYIKIMGVRGIKIETLQKLPIDLYMVKLQPLKYEFLYSPLAKSGYEAKQCLSIDLNQEQYRIYMYKEENILDIRGK